MSTSPTAPTTATSSSGSTASGTISRTRRFQVGFNVERRVDSFEPGDNNAARAVLFGRYVFQYGDSLYLPPMHYAELFVQYEDNFLPDIRTQIADGERFERLGTAGLHYRLDYLTPYWYRREVFASTRSTRRAWWS